MIYYLLVLFGTILVDVLPVLSPPAWTLMVFLQVKFGLDIWAVLVLGVIGSTIGRFLFSFYIAKFAQQFLKPQKNADFKYLGNYLQHDGLKFELFVFLYTLLPISSTPLFSATGIAHIKPLRVLSPFFMGKFISDMLMLFMGKYALENIDGLVNNFLSWQSLLGLAFCCSMLFLVFFIDWKSLLIHKKLKLNFQIWK